MLRPVKNLEVMGAKLHFRQKRESVFEIDIIFGTTGTLVVEGAQSIPVLTYIMIDVPAQITVMLKYGIQ